MTVDVSSVRRFVVAAPTSSTRHLSSRGRVALLETVLVLASVADLLGAQRPHWTVGFAVSVLAVASLLLRRRYPVLTMLLGLPDVLWGYALVAQLVATFTVAHRARDRRSAALLLGLVAVLQAIGLFWIDDAAPTDYTAQGIVFAVLIVGGPAALGLLLRAYDSLRSRLAELEASRLREHELLERSVLVRERTRLAREMHDVVSHQVSLIAVQAGALRMTAPDDRTRTLAGTLRELAVTTLTELRQMVGVLRESDAAGSAGSDLAPQPRLADLPALLDGSGLDVTLTAPALRWSWPAPVQRAAYRTVQEGLTNVRKHAPGAAVTVRVDDAQGHLAVEVDNGPSASSSPVTLPGGGHGLIGLTERAELLGARLTHTPAPGGGFRLRLIVPPPAR